MGAGDGASRVLAELPPQSSCIVLLFSCIINFHTVASWKHTPWLTYSSAVGNLACHKHMSGFSFWHLTKQKPRRPWAEFRAKALNAICSCSLLVVTGIHFLVGRIDVSVSCLLSPSKSLSALSPFAPDSLCFSIKHEESPSHFPSAFIFLTSQISHKKLCF